MELRGKSLRLVALTSVLLLGMTGCGEREMDTSGSSAIEERDAQSGGMTPPAQERPGEAGGTGGGY